jgi:hypothetical protein
MKLKPRWGWLLCAVPLILALLGYCMISSAPKIPVYEGKTFYQWATDLENVQANYSDPNRWKTIEAITVAIRAMGTNALPYVMADLRAQTTLKDRFLAWLAPRAKVLKLKPPNVADRWVRGIRALEVLGPLGKPYLPELVSMASGSTGYSEGALMAVGPDALPAFTNLLAGSTFPQTGNLIGAFANAVYADRIRPDQAAVALPYLVKVFQSTDSHGRWYAASALGAVHQDPDLCVPLLISGLADPTPSVRESCVQSLGAFGEAASMHAEKLAEAFDRVDALTRRAICATLGNFRSAGARSVPVLVRAVRDMDESVRVAAVVSLGQLTAAPQKSIPALTDGVQDPSRVVRIMAVQSLGLFGLQASNAIPDIERACSDPDDSVRSTATNALNRIREAR